MNPHRDFQVHAGAAGSLPFGFISRADGVQSYGLKPGVVRQSCDITFLEFFPIVVAVHMWPEEFSDHRICFWSDNQAVVSVLAIRSSRSS